MCGIYKTDIVIETGEKIIDVLGRNFTVYRKKYSYSPIYLISNDNEVFEIGYFDDESITCTYKESNLSSNDILANTPNEFLEIENLDNIKDFVMGINSLIQCMYRLKCEQKKFLENGQLSRTPE